MATALIPVTDRMRELDCRLPHRVEELLLDDFSILNRVETCFVHRHAFPLCLGVTSYLNRTMKRSPWGNGPSATLPWISWLSTHH